MTDLDRARVWIEAALAHGGGTHTFEDIAEGIANGRMQFWPAPRGCLITELIVYPRKRVLNVFLGGGDLDQLVDMHDAVAAWAKAQGCDAATINGRPGWQRVYRGRGWKALATTLVKDFGPRALPVVQDEPPKRPAPEAQTA